MVSVTAPSIAYQYQYASQEPELLERSFRYFSNAIHLAAELGADRVVVNSGWGYCGEDEAAMWGRCRDHLGRLCLAAGRGGILLVMESPIYEDGDYYVTIWSTVWSGPAACMRRSTIPI